jgi:ribosome-binding protein aMBF1 (putative translation factor)
MVSPGPAAPDDRAPWSPGSLSRQRHNAYGRPWRREDGSEDAARTAAAGVSPGSDRKSSMVASEPMLGFVRRMEDEEQLAARLGATIREARKARRWTQATLAEKLDVSVTYVGG